MGKETDKISQHHHAGLSTFGIGAEHGQQQWRSIVRQLLVQGYLRADVERYGALTLTEKSRPLLRGEITLLLREDLRDKEQKALRKKPKRVLDTVAETDRELWDALRSCRKRLADEQGIPPYVVFHDSTLMEMIEHRPGNAEDLITLNGVGQAKLERYGKAFLDVIKSAS
jgi:ATP-dependent DNA helicase RecQ